VPSSLRLLLIVAALWVFPAWSAPSLQTTSAAMSAPQRHAAQGLRKAKHRKRGFGLTHGVIARPHVRSTPAPDAASDPDDDDDVASVDALLDTGHRPSDAIITAGPHVRGPDGAWTARRAGARAGHAVPLLITLCDPRGPPASSLPLTHI